MAPGPSVKPIGGAQPRDTGKFASPGAERHGPDRSRGSCRRRGPWRRSAAGARPARGVALLLRCELAIQEPVWRPRQPPTLIANRLKLRQRQMPGLHASRRKHVPVVRQRPGQDGHRGRSAPRWSAGGGAGDAVPPSAWVRVRLERRRRRRTETMARGHSWMERHGRSTPHGPGDLRVTAVREWHSRPFASLDPRAPR